MDPTQIIAIPFALPKLRFFVLITIPFLCWTTTTTTASVRTIADERNQPTATNPDRMPSSQWWWQWQWWSSRQLHTQFYELWMPVLVGSTVMMMVFILCGADIYHHLYHTWWTSLYMSGLLVVSIPQRQRRKAAQHPAVPNTLDTTTNNKTNNNDYDFASFFYNFHIINWIPNHRSIRYPADSDPQRRLDEDIMDEIIGLCQFYGTWLVCIPCQILQILDWGIQIQRWPLPIVLGCTIGWVLGNVIGCLWIVISRRKDHRGRDHHHQPLQRTHLITAPPSSTPQLHPSSWKSKS
jgi:hypothetical protein